MIQKIIARAFIGCFLGFLSFSSFAAQKDWFEVDPNELYGHPRGVLLRDVYLYYWKGIAASSHLERSSDMLAEGEVVIVSKPQRTPRDPDYHKNYFRVDGWAPDHAYKSGAVPRDAVRVLTASELGAIREKRYPTVNRKGRAVGRSLLYVLPERGAGQPRGGGINEKRTPELDVLRRTADGQWYQVRYRSQAYNE
jgi:hypothetical protein